MTATSAALPAPRHGRARSGPPGAAPLAAVAALPVGTMAPMRLTAEHLCRLAAGRLEGTRPATAPLTGITTDSRQVRAMGAFVAVRGEHGDGHDHLADAQRRRAMVAVVDERPLGSAAPPLLVRVADTAAALRRACAARLAELECHVVGVTGSVGKTTAKEMIAQVLSAGGLAAARTPGNLNTWTAVPCSVLDEDGPVDAFVVEMAMSARGEIRDLASMCHPRTGVLLNVGVSHLELLGSREAIADAKAELLDALPDDGTAVLNADDATVRDLAVRSSAPVVWFGLDRSDIAFTARGIDPLGLKGTRFLLVTPQGEAKAWLPVPGPHLVRTACAAAAVATALGVELEAVTEALAEFRPLEQRGTLRTGPKGAVIYDDSYNSAPSSLAAALEVLGRSGSERRVAVLGDMLELGDETAAAHAGAGRQAARDATVVVAVGSHAPRVVAAAIRAGLAPDSAWAVRDADEAIDVVMPLCDADTTVLVKASRGLHLERVVERLVAAAEAEAD